MVFGIIFISEMMVKLFQLPKEESRKFVHIGVSNWWLLAMFTFDSWTWAIIPPILFILLNLASWYTGLFDSMERRTRDINNLGTVYFPIALLLLVVLTWYDSPVLSGVAPYIGGLGILAMGYGDGFAALIGTWHGKHKYTILGSTKSLEGSFTMFVAALIPIFLLIHFGTGFALMPALGAALFLAVLAALVEAVTPRGLDNLSVPLAVSFVWILFFV
jgi:phytol kinase